MSLSAFANGQDIRRVPPVKHAIQVGSGTPGFLSRPRPVHIEVADGLQIGGAFCGKDLGFDAEFLPLLHGRRCVARVMVGKNGAGQE